MSLRRVLMFFGVAMLLAACDQSVPPASPPPAFQALDITGAEYAQELPLPDIDGHDRRLAEFRGKVVVVFFGFTQCPDVCPTTLAEIAAAKKALGPAGERVQTVFISLDPERDTPELLKNYVTAFDPGVVALRGTPEQTQVAAKAFKVFFQRVPGKEPGSYSIDHTAGAYVFDTEGRIRLFVRYGQKPEAWVSDFRQLLS